MPDEVYRRGPGGLYVIPRQEFAHERFHYKAGEHVVFIGPTQRGKTTLIFVLLDACASPDLPAFVAVSKPLDYASQVGGKRLGFKTVRDWPHKSSLIDAIKDEKPRGYLVWPRLGDPDNDIPIASQSVKSLIRRRYADGAKGKKSILVMDDTVVKSKILKADEEMMTVITMGGAMGVGMWTAVQKPTDAGKTALWSYGGSEHLFVYHDPDKRNRQRYGEIGGFDPKALEEASVNLEPYQAIYLKRTGGFACIVDSE